MMHRDRMGRRWLPGLLLAAALLPATLPAFAITLGDVVFAPCKVVRTGSVDRLSAECTRFEVAENPAAPAGRRIGLRVVLVPARIRKAEADLVVLLAGGPGQSAVDAFITARAAFEPLRRKRHILLVDQRGTGGSNRLDCEVPAPDDEAALAPEALREAAARCRAQLDERADPRFYGTLDHLRDLETIRSALRVPQFNLVGGSYGTRVALEYLRRFPDAVRSVVLDAVVPPELALLQDHAVNLDEALQRIFDACVRDTACQARFGQPEATLAALHERVSATTVTAQVPDPIDFSLRRERLTPQLLSAIVRLYAYQPETAALLPLLLDEALAGRPQGLIAQGLLLYRQLQGQMARGMELSVVCAEDAPWLAARDVDRATLLGAALIEGALAQCAVWPHGAAPADFKQPVRSDTPVLILSGELDPVTPPRYGEQVARTLTRSRHLVAPGQGHTVMARGCLPRLVDEFVRTLAPQALDAACVQNLGGVPAFVGYHGAAP